MPNGAQASIRLNAYPNREEARVGAEYKTGENCRLDLKRSKGAQAASIVAHEASVASSVVELAESETRFAERVDAGGFSDKDVKRIISEFKQRRKEADQDRADIQAILERRR